MTRDFTTKSGFPTNVLLLFIRLIEDILTTKEVSHIAVAFDSGKKTFRNDISETYKANRPPMPEKLFSQLEAIYEYLRLRKIKY